MTHMRREYKKSLIILCYKGLHIIRTHLVPVIDEKDSSGNRDRFSLSFFYKSIKVAVGAADNMGYMTDFTMQFVTMDQIRFSRFDSLVTILAPGVHSSCLY